MGGFDSQAGAIGLESARTIPYAADMSSPQAGTRGPLLPRLGNSCRALLLAALLPLSCGTPAAVIELAIDTRQPGGEIDLTGYALGQTTPHAWREDRYTLLARYDAASREAAGIQRQPDDSFPPGSNRGDEGLNPQSAIRNRAAHGRGPAQRLDRLRRPVRAGGLGPVPLPPRRLRASKPDGDA